MSIRAATPVSLLAFAGATKIESWVALPIWNDNGSGGNARETSSGPGLHVERVTGMEPAPSAWGLHTYRRGFGWPDWPPLRA